MGESRPTDEDIRRVMAEMGRKGGLIGGKRRAERMTPEARHAQAVKAARVRWGHAPDPEWREGDRFRLRLQDGSFGRFVFEISAITDKQIRFWVPALSEKRGARRIGLREFVADAKAGKYVRA